MFEAFLSDPWADHPIVNRHICNFGGSSGSKETTTQETKLPEWVDQASRGNYQRAQSVVDNMKGPYTGPRTADLTQGQQSNIDAAQGNVGSTNNAYGAAQDTSRSFLNYNAPQVSAGQIANTDLSAYMNPFTKDVVNYGLQSLDMQRQQALAQTGAQASQARAFGGSRQGVQEGITNAAASMSAGKLASDLQSQNFMQAQGAASTDIGRRYAADIANQAASAQSAGINLDAAQKLASQATAGQASFLSGLDSAQGYQTQLQQQNQSALDNARALYGEQQQFPIDQLQILQGALTNSPYGKTVIGTQPAAQSNGLMQGLGAASSIAGIAGSLAPIFM
jgi:hypothetical protein